MLHTLESILARPSVCLRYGSLKYERIKARRKDDQAVRLMVRRPTNNTSTFNIKPLEKSRTFLLNRKFTSLTKALL